MYVRLGNIFSPKSRTATPHTNNIKTLMYFSDVKLHTTQQLQTTSTNSLSFCLLFELSQDFVKYQK